MAKRIFTASLTFTASAAGSAAGASTYMALKAQSNQLVDVLEVMITGKESASTIAGFMLARSSSAGVTPTALASPNSDGAALPVATALASLVTAFVAASTNPTPSNATTDAKLNLGMNAFGGIVRWNPGPTQQWQIIGSAAPGIESVLWNNSSAGGVSCGANAHIMYEPY